MPYHFSLPRVVDLTIDQQAVLNQPNAIAVTGGPGTGKSIVSLWRHIRNYDLGTRRSLLLTYTKTLETYLASSARSESEEAGSAIDRTYWWTSHGPTYYDEIIIDEAQDVEEDKYNIVRNHAGIVSYGADDQQIVYPGRNNQERLSQMFPNNHSYRLEDNFRNTYEIMLFIKGLFPQRLIPQHTLNGLQQNRRGEKPTLMLVKNEEEQKQAIIDIVNEFQSETHNIAILVPYADDVTFFSWVIREAGIQYSRYSHTDDGLDRLENVHVTTFKSSKGAEFDTVIIPRFHRMNEYLNRANRIISESDYYVALTRARKNLYMLSIGVPDDLARSPRMITTYTTQTF